MGMICMLGNPLLVPLQVQSSTKRFSELCALQMKYIKSYLNLGLEKWFSFQFDMEVEPESFLMDPLTYHRYRGK